MDFKENIGNWAPAQAPIEGTDLENGGQAIESFVSNPDGSRRYLFPLLRSNFFTDERKDRIFNQVVKDIGPTHTVSIERDPRYDTSKDPYNRKAWILIVDGNRFRLGPLFVQMSEGRDPGGVVVWDYNKRDIGVDRPGTFSSPAPGVVAFEPVLLPPPQQPNLPAPGSNPFGGGAFTPTISYTALDRAVLQEILARLERAGLK